MQLSSSFCLPRHDYHDRILAARWHRLLKGSRKLLTQWLGQSDTDTCQTCSLWRSNLTLLHCIQTSHFLSCLCSFVLYFKGAHCMLSSLQVACWVSSSDIRPIALSCWLACHQDSLYRLIGLTGASVACCSSALYSSKRSVLLLALPVWISDILVVYLSALQNPFSLAPTLLVTECLCES